MNFKGKTTVRKAALVSVLFLVAGLPAFPAGTGLAELKDGMDAFAEGMARELPFNAALGLNWSNAHIGRLFPAAPPHFGVGVSGGFSMMDLGTFAGLLDMVAPVVSKDLAALGGFAMPALMLEGRLGGLFLPFDLGVKIGFLPTAPGPFDRLDYFVVGGDLRYAVLKGNAVLPTVSVGVGINRLSGGAERGLSGGMEFVHLADGTEHTIAVSDPTLGIDWETTTVDFKAQVSKSLLVVTPYLGFGASRGQSKVAYGLNADVSSQTLGDDLKEVLAGFGISTDTVDGALRGFSSRREVGGWALRVFGGASVNLPLFRLDLTGMWNLKQSYGLTLGARFQL